MVLCHIIQTLQTQERIYINWLSLRLKHAWKLILIQKKAIKDIELLEQQPALLRKDKNLVAVLRREPFQNLLTFEKLIGDLEGLFLRRINIQHRIVYKVDGNIVYIIRI